MAHDIKNMLKTAERIAQEASLVPMAHFRKPLDIEDKADESPVTLADRATERTIRDALKAAYPDHGIYGEEYGVSGDTSGPMWVVDPIDGTRSFISGNPLFGMLLAFADAGAARLGVIRMPALGETFSGAPGLGAWQNGTPIRCRQTRHLDQAILYINEAEHQLANDPALFARLCKTGHTRRMGYDCYPHALVAAGHVDAVVDCNLEPYDFLALGAVIEAAGGKVTDWQGNPLGFNSNGRVISACTEDLHGQVLDVLHTAEG